MALATVVSIGVTSAANTARVAVPILEEAGVAVSTGRAFLAAAAPAINAANTAQLVYGGVPAIGRCAGDVAYGQGAGAIALDCGFAALSVYGMKASIPHLRADVSNAANKIGSKLAQRGERASEAVSEIHSPGAPPAGATPATEAGEQLSLFDANEYTAGGAGRAAEHGGNWQTADLGDAVRAHGGPNPRVSYSGEKTMLTNAASGTEVIIDNAGGYFRVRGADGVYRMLDGSPVPANVPILKPGGGSSLAGVPKAIRQALTHFGIG
jgi:hypothetical protein